MVLVLRKSSHGIRGWADVRLFYWFAGLKIGCLRRVFQFVLACWSSGSSFRDYVVVFYWVSQAKRPTTF